MHSLYTNEVTDCLKPAGKSLASIHQLLKNKPDEPDELTLLSANLFRLESKVVKMDWKIQFYILMRILSFKMFTWFMESKDWSVFGYFSPDLEKIKQLLVCSKHQNTWEDTGNVVKVFFSIQSKKKNVRQWKETEFSTPFVVKAATSLLLNSLKFTWKSLTFFCRETCGF